MAIVFDTQAEVEEFCRTFTLKNITRSVPEMLPPNVVSIWKNQEESSADTSTPYLVL